MSAPTEPVPPKPNLLRRALRLVGVDRAVGYSMLLQAFSLASRPLLLLLMVQFLTPKEQGYQYTILGLLGVKALFELGVGISLLHFVGREAGHLTVSPTEGVRGAAVPLARVASLFQKTVLGYAVIGVVFAAVMLPGGWMFLADADPAHQVGWQPAWVLAVLTTAVGFPIEGAGHVLFGCGQVTGVIRIRFVTTTVQAVVYGGLLAAHGGLIAAPLGNLAAILCQLLMYRVAYRPVFRDLWRHPTGGAAVRWLREVVPLQWRVAASWLSNYFSSQVLIPIVFRYQGDETAGRLGLTMVVGALTQGIAFAWVATKLPRYAAAVGQGRVADVRREFLRDTGRAVGVYLLGATAAVLVVLAARLYWPSFADRLLPVPLLLVVLVTSLCAMIVECLANCLNSFHRDPLMPVRVLAALVTVGCGYVVARYGEMSTVVATVCTTSLATAGVCGLIWWRFVQDRLAESLLSNKPAGG